VTAGPVSWERVESVLDQTLGLPVHARAAALDQLCGTDTNLRREVEALLTAHDSAGAFLETSAAEFASRHRPESTELVGATIGAYRVIEEIGRGGMGTIWLAERADGQFHQRVAIKLIKRGMDSDEILARFLRERQILARLEHPNIARLLDGGISADGRPWFVMEYVKGAPITGYCAEHRLGVEERLRRFVEVCRAVHHAHRNLVVHRDLKPSNVMVTEDGAIKLLDFGVAKLLADDETEALKTAPGHRARPMTPEYASPEQVAGGNVTTASDIYQLGVLLYELLAGQRPYEVAGRSPAEVERSICESQPRAPSTRAQEPVRKRLRGDLDAIVLRALQKEPEQRYPSVEALAEDIERHLANLPLRFPGRSRWYGTVKFVRRNRLPLTIAAGFTVLLLGMGARYTMDIRRERDRARQGEVTATESAALLRRFFQGWSPDAASRGLPGNSA
jgi:serine/threonine-protein kinase